MTVADKEVVLAALAGVQDPELHRDIVSLKMVRDVSVEDGVASFRLVLTTPACPLRGQIEADARGALAGVRGVERVEIEWGAELRRQHRRDGALEQRAGLKNIIAVASNRAGLASPRSLPAWRSRSRASGPRLG